MVRTAVLAEARNASLDFPPFISGAHTQFQPPSSIQQASASSAPGRYEAGSPGSNWPIRDEIGSEGRGWLKHALIPGRAIGGLGFGYPCRARLPSGGSVVAACQSGSEPALVSRLCCNHRLGRLRDAVAVLEFSQNRLTNGPFFPKLGLHTARSATVKFSRAACSPHSQCCCLPSQVVLSRVAASVWSLSMHGKSVCLSQRGSSIPRVRVDGILMGSPKVFVHLSVRWSKWTASRDTNDLRHPLHYGR